MVKHFCCCNNSCSTTYVIWLAAIIAIVFVFSGHLTTLLIAIIFVVMVKQSNVMFEVSKVNWTSIALALVLVGLEVGYVFVYRMGWSVSTASVVANIGLACVLLIVGYFLYKENVSIRQIIGIVVCMFGFNKSVRCCYEMSRLWRIC